VTKKTATISGSAFTVAFFTVFALSERHNRNKRHQAEADQEKFRLEERGNVTIQDVKVRPGNVLVEAADCDRLQHLQRVLHDVKPEKQDIVVVVIHRVGAMASSEYQPTAEQICGSRETELFSKVVSIAEKAGKHVELLTVPGRDYYEALLFAAQQLDSSRIVTNAAPQQPADEQARQVGQAWERLPEPRRGMTLEIVPPNGDKTMLFSLGPHPPRLWPSDIVLLHRLWQELSDRVGVGSRLHHRDVVSIALKRLDEHLHSHDRGEIYDAVDRELSRPQEPREQAGETWSDAAQHDVNPS
jgi:hypothetical protein